MMRGMRRLAVGLAVAGLLTGAGLSASTDAAHADTTAASCFGAPDTSTPNQCTLTATIGSASAITVTVTDTTSGASEDVTVAVKTLSCTDNSGTTTEPASSETGSTPLVDEIVPLPGSAADGQCSVAATVSVPNTVKSPTEFTAALTYTPTAAPSPSGSSTASPGHPVKGYAGKCLDDKYNSSANRAVVVIWTCSGTDPAESWKYSGNEFIHHGKCLNDQGNGGSRSKVILWTCNGAANEKWTELANGELKLQAHGGTLCLDDPAYSTRNGTQLIVYTCKDSANQKWSLP